MSIGDADSEEREPVMHLCGGRAIPLLYQGKAWPGGVEYEKWSCQARNCCNTLVKPGIMKRP